MKLLNNIMHDGSRHFLALPETRSWAATRDHIAALRGANVTAFLTDHVTEVWIDFRYEGQEFSVNNPYGEYWFFVKDPSAPESVLAEVAAHCVAFLSEVAGE